MAQKVKVTKANKKQIKTGDNKYGIQIEHPKLSGKWINIVDWDNVMKGKDINPGDEVMITKPENSKYGWQAKFAPQSTGFSDEEVQEHQNEKLSEQVAEIKKLLLEFAAKSNISLTTKQGEIDYPEPKQGQTPEEVQEAFSEDEETIEDLDW